MSECAAISLGCNVFAVSEVLCNKLSDSYLPLIASAKFLLSTER